MSINELFQDVAFEAEVLLAMTMAFDLACKSLRDGGYADLIQEIIAKRIILCACRGTADPVLLCQEALTSLGLHNDGEEEYPDETGFSGSLKPKPAFRQVRREIFKTDSSTFARYHKPIHRFLIGQP